MPSLLHDKIIITQILNIDSAFWLGSSVATPNGVGDYLQYELTLRRLCSMLIPDKRQYSLVKGNGHGRQ